MNQRLGASELLLVGLLRHVLGIGHAGSPFALGTPEDGVRHLQETFSESAPDELLISYNTTLPS